MRASESAFIPPAFERNANQVQNHLQDTSGHSLGVASRTDVKEVSEDPT